MKKIVIIFIVLLLIILAFTLKNSFSVNLNPKSASNPGSSNLETKENNEGPVSVIVTPNDLNNGLSGWDFQVVLNTHTEELTADLVTVSVLIDNQNHVYKPLAWEGDNSGGHHRKGILKFNPISPRPKSLELKIKNVGGVSERSFKWNL
ncbi:MAG: hypothetical protein M1268_02840 [Patescibacteria group bacterium]|nr:hypothetical protein [Actinomycetota bacterium]MCL5438902.1 hypothetical protein [Patescibacteria group bacterium]